MWLILKALNRNSGNTREFSKLEAGYARDPNV